MADLMTHLLWLSGCFVIDPARVFVGTQIVMCVRLFIFLMFCSSNRFLAANRKEKPMWQHRVSSLAISIIFYHMSDAI